MTALKYYDGTNWVTIGSIPGQAGVLATQRKAGVTATLSSGNFTASQSKLYDRPIADATKQPIEITYTPAVDCYWEVAGALTEVDKLDAAYHYGVLSLFISPVDEDGLSRGAGAVVSQHSQVMLYEPYNVRRIFRLRAGIAYTAYLQFTISAGTWTYYTGPDYVWIEGKAWPLISNTPPPAPAGVTPLLDVLPSTPVNGQEIYFQTTAMRAYGVMWHLRYNSNSASIYKWEFVGGSSLIANAGGAVSPGTTGWQDLTGGPDVTVPLAGDYDVDWSARGYSTDASAAVMHAGVAISGAPAVFYGGTVWYVNGQEGNANCSGQSQFLAVPAATILRLRYYVAATVGKTFEKRQLRVTPVRVG